MPSVQPAVCCRGRWLQALACLAAWTTVWLNATAASADSASDPLTPAERSWLREHGPLRYAVDAAFAPVEFSRADGAVAGIAPDFVAQLARNLDLPIVVVPRPSSAEAHRLVQLGQADFGATPAPTTALGQPFDFTAPFLLVPGHWIDGSGRTRATPSPAATPPAPPANTASLHFYVAKGNAQLLAILEKGVASLTDSQRRAVLQRWTVAQPGAAIGRGSYSASWILFWAGLTGLGVFAVCRFVFQRTLARHDRAQAESLAQHQAAESILRRGYEHAQAILRDAPFGCHVYRFHSDGRLMLAETNPTADRMLGLGSSSLIGRPLDEVFPNWRGTELTEALRRIAREGGTVQRQQVPLPQSPQDRSYELQAKQTLPGRVAIFLSDVTEQLHTEKAIRQRAAVLTAILNAIPQWVFWKDTQGEYLGCNLAFARGVGLDAPSEIVGRSDFDLPWSPREAEAQRADDHQVIEQNLPRHYPQEPLPMADGTHLLADFVKVPLTNATGEVLGVLGVAHDIRESVRVQDELNRALQSLQDTLDSLPFRVGWKDRNLAYSGANLAFALAAGVQAPQELVGRNDFDLSWRAEAESLRAEDRQVLETGKPIVSPVLTSRPSDDSQETWLQSTRLPLRDASNRITGVLLITEDITDRRRDEQVAETRTAELQQRLKDATHHLETAHQQLQSLTHSLHQDLHAPLRALEGYASMLAQDHGEGFDPEGLRLMDVLQRETRRMGQVIQTLLDQQSAVPPGSNIKPSAPSHGPVTAA